MTADHLAELARVAARSKSLLAERDRLIHWSLKSGASLRSIATAAGVSHQTVANIARRTHPRPLIDVLAES